MTALYGSGRLGHLGHCGHDLDAGGPFLHAAVRLVEEKSLVRHRKNFCLTNILNSRIIYNVPRENAGA